MKSNKSSLASVLADTAKETLKDSVIEAFQFAAGFVPNLDQTKRQTNERILAGLKQMGLVTQADMDAQMSALEAQIAALQARIETLENTLSMSAPEATPAKRGTSKSASKGSTATIEGYI